MAIKDNLDEVKIEVHHDTMKIFGWLFIIVSIGMLSWGVMFESSASSRYLTEPVVNLQALMYKMMILFSGMASGIAGLMLLVADVIAEKIHRLIPEKKLRIKVKEDPFKDAEILYEEDDEDNAPGLKPV